MSGDVIKLEVVGLGDGLKVECDRVLEAAKGKLRAVAVVGVEHDGTFFCAASDGASESHFLFARAAHFLVENEVARS